MSSTTRTLYNGMNSNITYQLLDNGEVQDLSNLTQIDLVFTDKVRLSANSTATTPLDFVTSSDRLVLNLGTYTVPAGAYPNVKVIVYDGEHTSGVVWDTISLLVKDDPYTGS